MPSTTPDAREILPPPPLEALQSVATETATFAMG